MPRQQLDCEISCGLRNAAGWQIVHSTFPWREGQQIRLQLDELGASLLVIGCAYRGTPGAASATKDDSPIARYMNAPGMIKRLAIHAIEMEEELGRQPECEMAVVGPLTVLPLAAIDFPPDSEHPVSGRWQVAFALNRCGQSRMHHVRFLATAGKEPRSGYYYTGLSLTSEQLMRDAFGVATMAAMLRDTPHGKCKDVDLYQVAASEAPAKESVVNGTFTAPWRAQWTFRLCGKLYDVGMRFEPGKSGGGTKFFAETGRLVATP